MRTFSLLRRLAAGLACVAIVGASASESRADFAYAFASQTISNLTLSPTGTVTNLTTFTQDGSTVNGSGLANSNPLDAPQAYQGGLPTAPANFFARYAPGNPPVSPVGNFTRGDAQILADLSSGSVVAESFLNTALPGSPLTQTGSGGLGASLSFTATTTGALTIAYNYTNRIFAFTTGLGRATASYGFGIAIRDSAGNLVFSASPTLNNLTLSSPPPGNEIFNTGSSSVTSGILTAGQTYSIAFNVTSQSSVSAVPEPSSVVLCCLGGLFPIGYRMLRKRLA